MNKYWGISKIFLMDALVYKAEGFIWTLTDITPNIVMFLYWSAAFAGKESVKGLSFTMFITYYFWNGIIQAMLTPHPERELSRSINRGDLSMDLLRPFSVFRRYLLYEITYKLNRLIFTIPSVLILYYLVVKIFEIKISFHFSILVFLILGFSFLLKFLIRFIFGSFAFWTTRVGWIISINDVIIVFLSGTLFPLELLPDWIHKIALWSPFSYYIYIPVKAMMNTYDANQIYKLLSIEIAWILLCYVIYKMVWNKGLKTYAAFGQ